MCIPIGERPTAIDGGWSDWGTWTECTRTCGGGVAMRQRICNKPPPSHSGRYCPGVKHEYKICNSKVSLTILIFKHGNFLHSL